MAVDLRWAVPAGTTTDRPRLQYRELHADGKWTAWMDVPYIVVPDAELKSGSAGNAGVSGFDQQVIGGKPPMEPGE